MVAKFVAKLTSKKAVSFDWNYLAESKITRSAKKTLAGRSHDLAPAIKMGQEERIRGLPHDEQGNSRPKGRHDTNLG